MWEKHVIYKEQIIQTCNFFCYHALFLLCTHPHSLPLSPSPHCLSLLLDVNMGWIKNIHLCACNLFLLERQLLIVVSVKAADRVKKKTFMQTGCSGFNQLQVWIVFDVWRQQSSLSASFCVHSIALAHISRHFFIPLTKAI